MMVYILFAIGFVILIKGADILVAGSASIAKKYKVSDMVIGLTIVSMGTSMPELIVNILASSSGSADIAIGNVIGSNISNILLILGVAALIYPLAVNEKSVLSEIPYSLIATLLLAFLANAAFFGDEPSVLSRIDGLILMAFFSLFMIYIIRLIRQGRREMVDDVPDSLLPFGKSVLFVVLGILGLFFGGKWVVEGAIHIASQFGLSEKLIGLTIVAIGTSLPELVTSAVAAYRKSTDIAVANVIGSNIFNLLWVLGISAMIKPMSYDPLINTDIMVLIGATCLIFFSMVIGKPNSIDRFNGVYFLLAYVGYLVFLIMRG
ncbi:MAG: calcium/sodium antiporter [Bacteroidia bacterium]